MREKSSSGNLDFTIALPAELCWLSVLTAAVHLELFS